MQDAMREKGQHDATSFASLQKMLKNEKKFACEKKVVSLPRQTIRNINPLKRKSMSVSTSCHNSDINKLWSKDYNNIVLS